MPSAAATGAACSTNEMPTWRPTRRGGCCPSFSRGGRRSSETFDHSSILRLLERRFGVRETNVSPWRRDTVGDLTDALGCLTRPIYRFPRLPNAAVPAFSADEECRNLAAPAMPAQQAMPVQERGSARWWRSAALPPDDEQADDQQAISRSGPRPRFIPVSCAPPALRHPRRPKPSIESGFPHRAQSRSPQSQPSLPPFQTLLDRHSADVQRLLVSLVGQSGAEDCFQETWLSALRSYPRLRADSNLRAWILTIAHRKAIDHIRTQSIRVGSGELDTEAMAARPDAAPPDQELWGRVRALPPKQRAAVALRYVSDLPYRQIAGALNCSEEAARRSVHEGLRRLREVYDHAA